jgi:uncharacterized protein YdaU (DUF1376 family)
MKNQYMPLFWGDFLANTLNLTAQEIGAYFLLIAHAWEHDGAIPYDDAQKIARVNNRHWTHVRSILEPFFAVDKDANGRPRRYYHGRVRRELTKMAELSNKRRQAALQMHAQQACKCTSFADVLHHGLHPSKKEDVDSFFPLPREPSVENSQSQQDDKSARSLATALPSGALTRSPSTEQADKSPQELTLAEINKRWRGVG